MVHVGLQGSGHVQTLHRAFWGNYFFEEENYLQQPIRTTGAPFCSTILLKITGIYILRQIRINNTTVGASFGLEQEEAGRVDILEGKLRARAKRF